MLRHFYNFSQALASRINLNNLIPFQFYWISPIRFCWITKVTDSFHPGIKQCGKFVALFAVVRIIIKVVHLHRVGLKVEKLRMTLLSNIVEYKFKVILLMARWRLMYANSMSSRFLPWGSVWFVPMKGL